MLSSFSNGAPSPEAWYLFIALLFSNTWQNNASYLVIDLAFPWWCPILCIAPLVQMHVCVHTGVVQDASPSQVSDFYFALLVSLWPGEKREPFVWVSTREADFCRLFRLCKKVFGFGSARVCPFFRRTFLRFLLVQCVSMMERWVQTHLKYPNLENYKYYSYAIRN